MRKTTYFAALAPAIFFVAVAFQSCTKGNNKLNYNLPMQTGTIEVTIPPTSDTTNAKDLGTGVNNFNVDSFIRANTQNLLGINNVQSVKLTSVKLTLINGTNSNNFANMQSCYASFYTNSNTTPYQVAITDNIDETSTAKDLPIPPDKELKGYLTGNNFTYSVGGKLRRPITDSLKCTIEFKFNVVVQN